MKPVIGLIGPGAMGLGITRALRRHGFTVHVRDINPERNALAQAAGAIVEPTAAAVARRARIVITVVVDGAQTDEVCLGAGGIVETLPKGGVVMMCSTVAPSYTAGLAQRLAEYGILTLDAPISGGPARAEAGTMSMMIAGGKEALDLCAGVLPAMSDKRFVVGDTPGQGGTMKLVNNLLAGIHNVAAAEALALGLKAGLDPHKVFDVVMASSGGSWMFGDRVRRLIDGDKQVAAAMPILTKDVGLALDLGRGLQSPLPLGAAAHQIFLAALAHGHAGEDDNAVFRVYQALTGVELP
ncbi:MAG: 3-hydroxyisobutyrate dehydrogenase [Betaproteobacteria bacterium]|nr:3-hydroxyisobutyrate dehydrogenase [Betaproteobacteria bacterium]